MLENVSAKWEKNVILNNSSFNTKISFILRLQDNNNNTI